MIIVINIDGEKLSEEVVWQARPHGCRGRRKKWRRQHGRRVATECGRTVMVVLPFVCSDHNCGILEWPLHTLLHIALLSGASIIASDKEEKKKQKNKIDEKTLES